MQNYVNEYKSADIFVSKIDNCGRNRNTTAQYDRLISIPVVFSLEKRRKTSKEIAVELRMSVINISHRTVRSRIV